MLLIFDLISLSFPFLCPISLVLKLLKAIIVILNITWAIYTLPLFFFFPHFHFKMWVFICNLQILIIIVIGRIQMFLWSSSYWIVEFWIIEFFLIIQKNFLSRNLTFFSYLWMYEFLFCPLFIILSSYLILLGQLYLIRMMSIWFRMHLWLFLKLSWFSCWSCLRCFPFWHISLFSFSINVAFISVAVCL